MSETTQDLLDKVDAAFVAAQNANPGKRVLVRPFAEELGADLDLVKKDQARRRMAKRRANAAAGVASDALNGGKPPADLQLQVSDGGRTRCFGLDRIVVWDNARNFFDKTELNGLGLSLWKTGGTIQDPFGYVKRVGDLSHAADGSEWSKLTKGLDPDVEICVLLGGERRFRAMRLLSEGKVIDGATEEPIVLSDVERDGFSKLWMKVIDEPTRKQKFVLNLTENTQRSELKFSELADRFTTMLAEMDVVSGSRVWTQESIGSEMGYDQAFVARVVSASRAPARVRKALDAGTVGLKIGALLGGLPPETAERAADDVAFGPAGPLAEKDAAGLLARKYRRELKTAIFEIDDQPALDADYIGERMEDAAAGDTSCRGCVEFSGNRPDVGGKTTCLNPACFVNKQIHVLETMVAGGKNFPEKWTWERTVLEGASSVDIWDGDEADEADIFDASGRVSPLSEFVDLAESPPGKLLAPEHRASSSIPKWGKILADAGLAVTVCFDRKGRVRMMVGLNSAVDAAKLSPFSSLFLADAGSGLLTADERAANNRVETAADSERRSVLVSGCAELLEKHPASGQHSADPPPAGQASSDVFGVDEREPVFGSDLAIMRLVIRGAWDQGLQKDDLIFLCEVLDGFGARPADARERLVTWLESGKRFAAELMGMLMLSLQVRAVRLNGFVAWTEVDENDFNPWARVCEAVEFDAASWNKQLFRRVNSVERSVRAKEDAWLEEREADRLKQDSEKNKPAAAA